MTDMLQNQENHAQYEPKQPARKKIWWIIAVAVAVIMVLAIIIGSISGDDYDYLTNKDFLKMTENPGEYKDRMAKLTGIITEDPVLQGDAYMFRLAFGDPERTAVFAQFLGSDTSLLKKDAVIELECIIEGTEIIENAYGEEREFIMVSGLSATEGDPENIFFDPATAE